MSSQQFPRSGAPPAALGPAPPPIPTSGSAGIIAPAATVSDESSRESEVAPREHMGPSGSIQPREEKQEPVVVRPYPQVQMLTQHHPVQSGAPVTVTAPPAHLTPAVPLSFSDGLMKPPLKPTMPSRPIAPAPPSTLSAPTKVPGQVTVTMESSIPQAPTIPVATISGQQGHPSNLHHIMATNVQMSIIRSSAPGPPLHIGASHLPRGAAAAAVMSSSKVTTVLRPASQLPNAAAAQPAVQHIIHQPIQSRPPVTTSSTIPPAVVATVSATRAQSPVITTTAAHATESTLSRPTLSIQQHPPSAAISIQRPAQPRDTATRITLPSHPAIGTQKPQLHTMAQKTIFSTGTPVAAATVAPILATNTIASATTAGSVSHTQAPTSTIVTMTMPSHSSHATAVTTSNIPVAKVVPQQITHTSPRIQSDYTAERSNLIPLSSHRASPNPVAMETRNDNRQSVPVQFQYFLPTYPPSAYPLTAHTYTPITSSVSTIRQYPVSAQAPNSAITAQTGVGVASTVHLNPMQLMTVDASHARHIQGIQPAPISAQGIQPAPISAQGIQPAPIGTQGLHPAAPMGAQGLQPAPIGAQQPPGDTKTSVVLADGATIVANPISNTFNTASAATTVVQTHNQSASASAPAQGSSPRPSILRKKPATDGLAVRKSLIPPQPPEVASTRVESTMRSTSGSPRPAGGKPKPEIHVSMATPVPVSMEAVCNQGGEQPSITVPPTSQQPPSAIPTIIAAASPTSQPAAALSTIPGAVAAAPPTSTTIVAAPAPPSTMSGALSAVLGPVVPEIKIKPARGWRWGHAGDTPGTRRGPARPVPAGAMKVKVISVLEDNYMYLVIEESTRDAVAVDAAVPKRLLEIVRKEDVVLRAILTTHHHWDHARGNEELAQLLPGLQVFGADERIGALTHRVTHGQELTFGAIRVRCLFTPCHTSGHMCYFMWEDDSPDAPALFSGDTLFVGGCGQFFEGTAEQMHSNLTQILGTLPKDTKIFCGHECTVRNLKFALKVEPDNEMVKEKLAWAKQRDDEDLPTVPSTLQEEFLYNPFLRLTEESVQRFTGRTEPVEVLRALRSERDNFKKPKERPNPQAMLAFDWGLFTPFLEKK